MIELVKYPNFSQLRSPLGLLDPKCVSHIRIKERRDRRWSARYLSTAESKTPPLLVSSPLQSSLFTSLQYRQGFERASRISRLELSSPSPNRFSVKQSFSKTTVANHHISWIWQKETDSVETFRSAAL
jgi:hypothetical protein